MYELSIKRQIVTIEGGIYLPEAFKGKGLPGFALKSDFHHKLYQFLHDWFSRSPFLKVKTSGSTGSPKTMMVEKSRMMQSAKLTCSFLGLERNDKALLCMSLDYIAGKMMVVRALVAGLDLYPVTPSGNPLVDTDIAFDFSAMTPMQVYNSLQGNTERKRLADIKKLIIGGGTIDDEMAKELQPFPNAIYSTYGMTETLSHIALRKINGKNASENYMPFQSVNISLSDDNTLIIDAPLVSGERLYTNDIAVINDDGSFCILGRIDNVINSGGVKIQTEELERMLKPYIDGAFAITALPDAKFGEIVVLLVEKEIGGSAFKVELPNYYDPKKVIKVDAIPYTETGKIDRSKAKELALEWLNNDIKKSI